MMELYVGSVTFSIPFMFPDPQDLRWELNAKLSTLVGESDKFKKRHGEAALALTIVLERKTMELTIKGPSADKELVDYAIWLPYRKIKDSENYRIAYLNYLKEGILKVLAKYDFDLIPVEEVFSIMEKQENKKNDG